MAPHYTPPRLDGGRPGTFWFNLERATAGTGWDLEAVAFHEAVPGHHLQLSRIQLLDELPAMQRQRALSVFAEGWALYAEQLAEEMGLYSDTESLLGGLSASLMRAARLVVDTGLHALGWSRHQALQFMVAHVPQPESFLANEIDRYIVCPGPSSFLSDRQAGAPAATRRREPPARCALHAPRVPRRRARQRVTADARAPGQDSKVGRQRIGIPHQPQAAAWMVVLPFSRPTTSHRCARSSRLRGNRASRAIAFTIWALPGRTSPLATIRASAAAGVCGFLQARNRRGQAQRSRAARPGSPRLPAPPVRPPCPNGRLDSRPSDHLLSARRGR